MTQEELKRLIHYNPDTGIFTRLVRMGDKGLIGQEMGYEAKGYIIIPILKTIYPAQRLAYLYMTGSLPYHVDHKDTNTLNNKWNNLRAATKSENGMNAKLRKDSSTGIKGIVFEERCKGYQARVVLNRKNYTKRFSIKKYNSKEKAEEAAIIWVRETRQELHKEFTNHG